MRIDRLEVRDFLGIQGSLHLPLDARLTVIHAPNGSGKTSLCEALEWGLLGQVRRLGIRTRKEQGEAACRFSPGGSPWVRMDLSLPSGTLQVERTRDGLVARPLSGPPITKDNVLFSRLAPGAAPEGLAPSAANLWRADWIHGTRFLAGEDLATLLEEDGEAPGRSRTVMAQLFGVTELERRERLLEAFLEEPPSLRTLDRELEAVQRAVDVARDRLKAAMEVDPPTRIRQVLGQAVQNLAPWEEQVLDPALREALVRLKEAAQAAGAPTGARDEEAPSVPSLDMLQAVLHERVATRRRIQRRIRYWKAVESDARAALERTRRARLDHIQAQFAPLQAAVSALFQRAQVNRVFDGVGTFTVEAQGTLEWKALAEPAPGEALPRTFATRSLSLGQRQDLALAIFLARARSLGGTFILDEPMAHLDDLNKVALLDILRGVAVEPGVEVHLVLTTASSRLVRHLEEKMHAVPPRGGRPPLRVVRLAGNARLGVRAEESRTRGLQLG